MDHNGLFPIGDVSESEHNHIDMSDVNGHEFACDTMLEDLWRKAYEERRGRSKCRNAQQSVPGDPMNTILSPSLPTVTSLCDGSKFCEAQNMMEVPPNLPKVNQQPRSDPEWYIDIDAMILEFNLNMEQARAFKIISEHSLERNPEPLRMYMGGAGGMGKSTVIQALKVYFE